MTSLQFSNILLKVNNLFWVITDLYHNQWCEYCPIMMKTSLESWIQLVSHFVLKFSSCLVLSSYFFFPIVGVLPGTITLQTWLQIATSPQIKHFYQDWLYWLTLEAVGNQGVITMSSIPTDFALGAAAGTYRTVDTAPTQLCSAQTLVFSKLQLVNQPKRNHNYFLQCCPTTQSLAPILPPSLVASVQYRFQRDGSSDYFQNSYSRGSSDT